MPACRFYKLAPEEITVFYDEIDLAAGRVRVKRGGGAAGHNGLRSIQAHLGTAEFRRVRIGIGHPGDKARVTGHVLGDFAKADKAWVEPLIEAVADALPDLVADEEGRFMNKVSLALQDTPAAKPKKASRPKPPEADVAPAAPAEKSTLSAAFSAALARLRKHRTKDVDGTDVRYRRPAECRQVDPLQCAYRNGARGSCELPVLYGRAECRPGTGARPSA